MDRLVQILLSSEVNLQNLYKNKISHCKGEELNVVKLSNN